MKLPDVSGERDRDERQILPVIRRQPYGVLSKAVMSQESRRTMRLPLPALGVLLP